jgi:hypothetical protein
LDVENWNLKSESVKWELIAVCVIMRITGITPVASIFLRPIPSLPLSNIAGRWQTAVRAISISRAPILLDLVYLIRNASGRLSVDALQMPSFSHRQMPILVSKSFIPFFFFLCCRDPQHPYSKLAPSIAAVSCERITNQIIQS